MSIFYVCTKVLKLTSHHLVTVAVSFLVNHIFYFNNVKEICSFFMATTDAFPIKGKHRFENSAKDSILSLFSEHENHEQIIVRQQTWLINKQIKENNRRYIKFIGRKIDPFIGICMRIHETFIYIGMKINFQINQNNSCYQAINKNQNIHKKFIFLKFFL